MRRVTLFVLTAALAAMVPTFALAKPMPSSANDRAHYGNPQANNPDYGLGAGEIPYLSQGIGVNEENFRGSTSTTQKRVEIPYLSQGVGVTSAELFGVAADDRAFSRATTVEPAPIVVSKESGWSVDLGNSAFAAVALMLGLLAGGTGVAIWQSKRTRLSPA
jgi:hypothetical protein